MRFLVSIAAVVMLAPVGLAGQSAETASAEAESAPEGMALIPAGSFQMGRTKTTDDDSTGMRPLILRDDRPVHEVWIDAFYMDRLEASYADYAGFVEATGHRTPYHWIDGEMPPEQANQPIYNVDWDDATAYCAWQGKRLPTEAEWERAARGGLEGKAYPWGDEKPSPQRALYSTPAGPGPVGKYPANDFGLHDMAGGVTEWCSDWFERTYYERSPAKNPQGPEDGQYRIIRGGSWSSGPARITVFFRNWVRPNQRTPNLGFRCVQDAE